MSDCTLTILGRKRCRFEARYSYGAAKQLSKALIDSLWPCGEDTVAALEASREKTYVHDVCVACGKIVKR